jgi:tRNA nucleotidyltransferase/poly(A) polymerase/mannose-6-phosphate isomerase-like protein (cupin superfamily)/GNAT superfamily N-acetyltransferase
MSNVGKYLVEELLKEVEQIEDYVVVYSGRFQPFHKGHYATYSHLVKKFGKNNVYIGTSDKTDKLKSPFNFKEKREIMMKMFGIPSNRIFQIKNPYAPTEILKKFNEKETAFITVVGEKDSSRLGGKYFTPYKGSLEDGYGDKGYVYISPSQPNAISGTDVRNWLGKGDTVDRKKLFTKAYPKFDEKIFNLIITRLDSLNESIFIPKEIIEYWATYKLNDFLKEVSLSNAGGVDVAKDVDDGPNFFFPNYDTFDTVSKSRAEQIGYTVFKQIMSKDLEDYYEHPIYPNGPVKAVTPFPAGVIGKTTATNQKDFGGVEAYDKWYRHVTRTMGLAGYQLVKGLNDIAKELSINSANDILQNKDEANSNSLDENSFFHMGYPSKEQFAQKKKERDTLRKSMDKNSEYYEPIDEDITVPISVGDTVLGGKFKNKRITVKDIGKNEKGEITINGKPLLKYRLIDEAYNEALKEMLKLPQFEEILSEIPMDDLQQINKFADKQFNPVDVVITHKHFLDRLVDPRNKKPISAAELIGFFKRLAKKKDEFVQFLKKYGEIVAKDDRTKINIPFMKQANKAIAKTIMRKDDFKTPSPELKFEAASKGNMYEPKRITAYYEALCKSEGIKPLPVKFEAVGKGGAATTYNSKTMKPLYISFNVNRLSDPEFAIIHELTHQIKLETEGDAYVGKRDQLAKFKKLENKLIDKYVYSKYSKLLYENKNNEDWAIFRLNNGKKWYATRYNPMMKHPDEYKSNVKYSSSEVLKFTHDKAIKIIQNDIGIGEKYGIVNNKGIQKKFDWRVKYPKKYEDVASLINETMDYGKSPYVFDLEDATEDNEYFRKTIWTGNEMQMTLMSIDDEIGLEVHKDGDQFIRVEDGRGKVLMGKDKNNLTFEKEIEDDYAIFIPAGYYHNIINTSDEPLKLYVIYSPVEHPKGKVDITKPINEDTVKYISKSLGVPHSKMPQIASKDIGDFVKYVKDKGISVSPSVINVSKVGMTQKDINVDKIKGLLGADKSHLAKPVIISKDNYILDGHHRVAALYNVDNNFKLKTIKVDIGIKDLLKLAKDYPKTTFKSITEGSNIGTLGSGNNSARWTPSGKKKELGVEQLSGYIQKDFPIADSVDISGEKDSWVGTSKTAKYHNKVKAKRDGSGNLVFEGIESNLEKKYGVDLDVYEYPTHLELRRIVVPQDKRGQGIGSKVMDDLIKYAKSNKKDLFTTPDSSFGGSKSRLVQFYKSFGFKDNKGSNRDFRSKETMVRLSEGQELEKLGINDFKSLFKLMPSDLQKRVYNLKNFGQRLDKHPEGNVLKHTITVVNRSLKDDDIDIAIAAMFHDIGKDETAGIHPKKGHITHFGHEKVSASLVSKYKDWIKSVGGNPANVLYIVKNHMRYKQLSDMRPQKQDKLKSFRAYDKLDKFSKHDRGGLDESKQLKLNIPSDIKKIHSAFKKNGKKLYIVGGAVRDAILGNSPKDFDLTTDANPDEVLQIAKDAGFSTAEIGKAFGVVIVNGYEIATFRKDIGKGRRPSAVDYTDIEGDVKRRDLTVNALFYDMDRNEIVDLVGGIEDLKKKNIRTVGNAVERFDEDPLRKLRALRFQARLGGTFDKELLDALQKDPSLNGVSTERIRDEFIKSIKTAKDTKQYMELTDKIGFTPLIFPNLKITKPYIKTNDYILFISAILRKNSPSVLTKSLSNLKYTNDEKSDIVFLVSLQQFKPDEIVNYKKLQEKTSLSDNQILEFGKIIGKDFKKFINFKLSVGGKDVPSDIKGPQIGLWIKNKEKENFLKR